MNSPEIGKKCWTLQVAVKGDTSVEGARKVVDDIIAAIGMTTIFDAAVFTYEGDIGLIYVQPIYESFVAYDAWPCHGGGYITITSCKEFKSGKALEAIFNNGYEIIDSTRTSVLEI